MALAYAVVFVAAELYDNFRRDAVAQAQVEADKKFEHIAQEARLTQVTRNPEPRVMTHPEVATGFPHMYVRDVVGLYFTADIT